MSLFLDPRRRPWWAERHPYATQLLLAFVITLVTEMLARRSMLGAVRFFLFQPAVFTCDFLIVLLSLSIPLLLPRRQFFTILICAVWLGLATADFIVLGFRITPISAIDLLMLKSVWSIVGMYLSPLQMGLMAVVVLLALVALIRIWLHAPRAPLPFLRAGGMVLLSALVLILWLRVPAATKSLSSGFANLHNAYETYGFAYCFGASVVDRGVDRPEGYSDDTVVDAVGETELSPAPDPDPAAETVKPNVIFVQLESFFDPSRIAALTYAEDPIPNFRALKETCSHGWLTVPVLGAGTVNTEFEVLTGMSLTYFGAGEYPYETILQKTACETLCNDLRSEGYSCHAIHNNKGNFYDRNKVFSSLGFDTFASVEYMQGVTFSPTGWACDRVLTNEILKAMNTTTNRDLVYTITVQAHGKYPREQLEGVPYMENTGFGDEGERWAWGYYLTQLQATDSFIGDLTEALSKYSEPCVVVLYGDHLPNFNISDQDLSSGTVFDSEYVIWSNFGLEKQDKDLYAYQLSADVMARLGYDDGVLTKLHQRSAEDPDYQHTLELLEYDLLYGDRAATGGSDYQPTDLQMGTLPVLLHDVRQVGASLYISGHNFTRWSKVLINGNEKETLYIDGRNLMVADTTLEPGDRIAVAQFTDGGTQLSQTEELTYGQDEQTGQNNPAAGGAEGTEPAE
ncbi:MAG: LTA synthase family protein [Clostridiaceae bacterium]|nr:LTA synthase family protein [Clostridiaceae bacterium]